MRRAEDSDLSAPQTPPGFHAFLSSSKTMTMINPLCHPIMYQYQQILYLSTTRMMAARARAPSRTTFRRRKHCLLLYHLPPLPPLFNFNGFHLLNHLQRDLFFSNRLPNLKLRLQPRLRSKWGKPLIFGIQWSRMLKKVRPRYVSTHILLMRALIYTFRTISTGFHISLKLKAWTIPTEEILGSCEYCYLTLTVNSPLNDSAKFVKLHGGSA
jgi:hypothetical protein